MVKQSEGAVQVSEKRRYRRHLKLFLLRLKIIGGATSKEGEERTAEVRNASRGGLLLSTKFPITPETLVELQIPEGALGSAKLLNGKICWYRVRPETGDHEIGLAFVRINPPKSGESESEAEPQPQKDPKERRRSPREPKKLLVRVRLIPEDKSRYETDRSALLLDLSPEGAEISTSRDLPRGSVVQVRFPDTPAAPEHCLRGMVVWSRPGDMEGKTLIGVCFEPPDPAQGPA